MSQGNLADYFAAYPGNPTGVSTTIFDCKAGTIVIDTTNNRLYRKVSAQGSNAIFSPISDNSGTVTTYTGATDAIDISLGDVFILNRSGAVDAATLAAPAAADNGRTIWIKNGTTQANTITVAGSGLGGSGTSYDVITFTAVAAANVTLKAYDSKWYMVGQHLAAVA